MKYTLLKSQYIQINGSDKLPIKVYKILALKTFDVRVKGSKKNDYEDRIVTVKEGDIGGFVQSENNLPQNDNSWVFHTACVFENAELSNSCVLENAKVCNNSKVVDSTIRGKSKVFGKSTLLNTFTDDNVDISDGSQVIDSFLYNSARVNGQSKVEKTEMYIGSRVNKLSHVTNCKLSDQSEVTDGAVCNGCVYEGQTFIRGGHHLNETLKQEIQLDVVSVADPNRKDF